MELLIPGLILVALMVYVSTKIKKSAAQAYETERIDTEEFSITKPEGFINPLNTNSPFAFEAFTKEFGSTPNERLRKASAELRIIDGGGFDEVVDSVRTSAANFSSSQPHAVTINGAAFCPSRRQDPHALRAHARRHH